MDRYDELDGLRAVLVAALVGTVAFIGWLAFVSIPESNRRESAFISQCEQAGGVPSRYETIVGKTHQSERLCIKHEAVAEMISD